MATLTRALVDWARLSRQVVVGPRVEGASQAAADHGQWFPARLVVGDAAEALDPEGGQRRVIVCRQDGQAAPGQRVASVTMAREGACGERRALFGAGVRDPV